MATHPLAGKPAPASLLDNIPRLVSHYYSIQPDMTNPRQQVSFGTSGHRGVSSDGSFNEEHILAICQATAEYRKEQGYTGPLFLGMDTHALSEPAFITAIEVLAAHDIELYIDENMGFTPTPVISHAILAHNKKNPAKQAGGRQADGIVITPSHNPPSNGGFKYNPPSGGPADTAATSWIQNRANEILEDNLIDVLQMPYKGALEKETTYRHNYIQPYLEDLKHVVDMDAIAQSGLKIGVDPMGGAGLAYWEPMAEHYGINFDIVNQRADPHFAFMTVDKDGKIRMDCSSPYAMASLIALKDNYDIAFGNDPDYDRHGIVTKAAGLLTPNHYLAVAINYLFQNRPDWSADAAVGKTLVSSSMIDRVANKLGRTLAEVPVGFKWFVDGLLDGSYGFGGEESAGASFLRMDGTVWTTDKDGFILDLLAAEIMAKTEQDPAEHYAALEAEFGSPVYGRLEAEASLEQKDVMKNLSADLITAKQLAGDDITAKLTHAPANGAAIGGLKVTSDNGWFAARPSGTEDIYKIYAESFKGETHLKQIQDEAQEIVSEAFKTAGL